MCARCLCHDSRLASSHFWRALGWIGYTVDKEMAEAFWFHSGDQANFFQLSRYLLYSADNLLFSCLTWSQVKLV